MSAAFEIREAFYLGYPEKWPIHDTDTVTTGLVQFVAKEPDAQYEWRLGSEVIRTPSFSRSDFPPGKIQVYLKVTRAPNPDCFPSDSGVATSVRSFYNYTGCYTLLNGRYRGVLTSAPLDTVVMFIDLCKRIWPDFADPTKPVIGGFLKDCDTLEVFSGRFTTWGHRHLLLGIEGIRQRGPCLHLHGLVQLKPNDTDSLLFDFTAPPCTSCSRDREEQFRGVRIPV